MSSVVRIAYSPFAANESLADVIEALQASDSGTDAGFDDRIAAMDLLAKQILAPSSPIRKKIPSEGLAYLATFLQQGYLQGLIARELADVRSLTEFVSVEARKSIRHVPRGLVCHWVAGNVPLLPLFSWAISVVLGNRNVIRLSSRQNDVVSPFLEVLQQLSEAGKVIANETVVVSFDSDNVSAHRLMSEAADARIAWGGQEAVSSIRGLPTHWECEDIVFGPRVSMAVVDPAVIDAGGIRRLATDVVVFDQMACSSPQSIFVKARRNSKEFQSFRDRFSREFDTLSSAYPRHALDFSETYQIGLDRARVLLDGGEISRDRSTSWTVAVVDRPNDTVQCANRFVQLIPFEALDEVFPLIPRNIQTVVSLLGTDDLAEFTEIAAKLGVCRFPRPGEGNNFENPWDGTGLVSRLTRAVMRTDNG